MTYVQVCRINFVNLLVTAPLSSVWFYSYKVTYHQAPTLKPKTEESVA